MVTLTSFLFPQAERSRRSPTTRPARRRIGHAMLNEILARKFDGASDPDGDSVVRCGETNPRTGLDVACTAAGSLGAESSDLDNGELKVALADDVDDFIGCWGSAAQCHTSSLAPGWRADRTSFPAKTTRISGPK